MLGFGPPNRFPLGENFRGGLTGSLQATLDAATISAAGALALKGALTKTLDDVAISATGAAAIKASLAVTLDDAALVSTIDYSDLFGTLAVTLDDVVCISVGSKLPITDLDILQLPVDCVLAGHQPYKESGREYEIPPRNTRERGGWRRSRVGRIRGDKPSFTVTTNRRGYD